MKLKKLFLLCSAVLFINANAQEFKLGKVSVAELQEKIHFKDTSAVAAVLFEKGKVSFQYSQDSQEDGFFVVTEVATRLKIYKKEGYEWANKKIRYYLDNNSKEKVSFTDAVTYNLVDGKIEKTKLKSDGEFDERVNKYWAQKKIVMPNVKEGSIIEFQYIIRSPRIGELRDWNFQTNIPVNYSEFKTYIPQYFTYKPNSKGFVFPKLTVEKGNNSFNIKSKDRSTAMGFSPVKTTYSEDKINYTETITTYLAENLSAIKEEAYVNNMDNYTSSISHELARTDFPNQPYKMYSTDWESVVKTIYDYEDFGPELNKTGYFEEDLNSVIKGISAPNEKLSAIFNFVKNSVKWNDYYGYSCNDGVKKAYKEKTGNVAEINLMLTAMLRYAGFTADPVLVSTRSNGISFFPNRTAFNYVIAAVQVENKRVLLDATEKFASPDVLPIRDLNWNGRLIRKDGSSEVVDLMPKSHSVEQNFINYTINSNGTLEGKIQKKFTNHAALLFRNQFSDLSEDTYLEKFENNNNNIEIDEYVRVNDQDLAKPIVETYSFKDSKDIEIINGKIYFSPLIFMTTKENPFKLEERSFPIDFGYPTQGKFHINIEIPAGYVIESVPEAINIATGYDIGSFKYNIGNANNKIQVVVSSDINTAIVTPEYYPILKEYFQKMVDKQNEKIVLKKI